MENSKIKNIYKISHIIDGDVKYIFVFMCIECKNHYNNLFDARYCLHPKYYNIKCKL